MKRWILSLSFLLIAICGYGQSVDELFVQGNSQYEAREYEAALATYQEIEQILATRGEQSVDLYHNMGCAAFRLEDMATARYWLERARRLDPGDRSILHNLAVLKLNLVDRVKEPPRGAMERAWDALTRFVPYGLLAFVVLLLLLAAAALGGLLLSGRLSPKPLYYGLGTVLFFLMFTFLMLNSRAGEMTRPEAVVTASEVEIFSEPNTSSSLLFRLHAGTLINVEEQHGGFIHVSLPDGMNGWGRRQDFRNLN